MAKEVQSLMKTHMGRAVGVGQYDQIESMAWFPPGLAKTADYTLSAKESGTFISNVGATTAVVITLPPIADGPWIFHILVGADFQVNVAAETADTLIVFNNIAADDAGYETASELIGGAFMAYCDGTSAFLIPLGTGGHVQTLTVNDA